MKVLHVIRHGNIGGCESHLLELLKNMRRAEFEPHVISFGYGEMVDRVRDMQIPFQIWSEYSFGIYSLAKRIKAYCVAHSIDIIHCHDRKACNSSMLTKFQMGVPIVYGSHCWSFHQQGSWFKKYILRQNERFLVRHSGMNIAASDTNQREGVNYLQMDNSVVISHGIDLNRFDPEAPPRLSKKVFGIPEDYTVVGFIARLTRQQDPITFLRAAALAIKEQHNIYLLIVGDGALKEACKKEIENLGIGNHVTFESLRPDVEDLLKIMDIFCLPSQYEGLSIGLLEAMAMKKAIIASPVNGTLEIIANNIDGMLAAVSTPESWKDAILQLHHDPKLREELGARARMLVEEHYNIETTVDRIQEVYRNILPKQDISDSEVTSESFLHSI